MSNISATVRFTFRLLPNNKAFDSTDSVACQPHQVSEHFSRTIELILLDFLRSLGPDHSQEAWEAPAELIKRTFTNVPSSELCTQLHKACLRMPLGREHIFWMMCCSIAPSGSALVRAWLLRHESIDAQQIERAACHLQHMKGEHAAALDFMRWAEAKGVLTLLRDDHFWRALYFKILRHTAEERAASMKRRGILIRGGALDMLTDELHAEHPMRLTCFKSYRFQLTDFAAPLHNITQTE